MTEPEPKKSKFSTTKIITGFVAAGGLLTILLISEKHLWVFFVLLSVVMIVGTNELFSLFQVNGSVQKYVTILAGLCMLWGWYGAKESVFYLLLFVVPLLFYTLFFLPIFQSLRTKNIVPVQNLFCSVLSLLYLGVSLFLVGAMAADFGIVLVLWTAFVTYSSDIGAYFTGVTLGKTKCFGPLSPNKSLEGFFGGMAASAVMCILLFQCPYFSEMQNSTWWPRSAPVWSPVVVAALMGAVGQFGDLFESYLKRSSGVKDTGDLFPGHGGILDRIDSVLFTVPFLWLILIASVMIPRLISSWKAD